MNRMNKEELLTLIKTLKIDVNEFYILSSGALVLREIYPLAGDLDIAVTSKGLEQLKSNYDLIEKEYGWYTVCDNIECIVKDSIQYEPDLVDGYYVQNIEEYYNYLLGSDREKDKLRLPLIRDYFNKCYRRYK